MPEGPELEVMRRGLTPLVGERLNVAPLAERRKYLTRQQVMENLRGVTLRKLERRGKRLAFVFDNVLLTFGAGMSGYWRADTAPAKHDILAFSSRTHRFFLNDVRRFGFMQMYPPDYVWDFDIGPDGLNKRLMLAAGTGEMLRARFAPYGRHEIKPALLDQGLVAGLGNIYAAEALWILRRHPATKVADFDRWDDLPRVIYQVLASAVHGRGTTLRFANPYQTVDGKPTKGFACQVYDREGQPCRVCNTAIVRYTQAGRSTWFCPTCQPAT